MRLAAVTDVVKRDAAAAERVRKAFAERLMDAASPSDHPAL